MIKFGHGVFIQQALECVRLFLYIFWFFTSLSTIIAHFRIPQLSYFRNLMLKFASRGKLWTPTHRWSVPQYYFFHFYAFGLFWNTLFFLLIPVFLYSNIPIPNLNDGLLLLILMEIHLLRRFYETVYVMVYKEDSRMHFLGYLFGLSYYFAVPLSLFLHTLLEPSSLKTLFNSSLDLTNMWKQLHSKWNAIIIIIYSIFISIFGTAIFLWGSFHQYNCHRILGNLRKGKNKKLDSVKNTSMRNAYNLPRGDWFEYVSCPHYFSELVLYFGLLVISNFDFLLVLLFAWVFGNLSLSAIEMHAWYKSKYDDYPIQRCAFIPYVY